MRLRELITVLSDGEDDERGRFRDTAIGSLGRINRLLVTGEVLRAPNIADLEAGDVEEITTSEMAGSTSSLSPVRAMRTAEDSKAKDPALRVFSLPVAALSLLVGDDALLFPEARTSG